MNDKISELKITISSNNLALINIIDMSFCKIRQSEQNCFPLDALNFGSINTTKVPFTVTHFINIDYLLPIIIPNYVIYNESLSGSDAGAEIKISYIHTPSIDTDHVFMKRYGNFIHHMLLGCAGYKQGDIELDYVSKLDTITIKFKKAYAFYISYMGKHLNSTFSDLLSGFDCHEICDWEVPK